MSSGAETRSDLPILSFHKRGPGRRFAKWRSRLVAALVVSLFVILARRHLADLGQVRVVAWAPAVAVLPSYFLARAISGEALRRLLTRSGRAFTALEAFWLMILTSYANLALPRVGLAGAAYWLKRRHGIGYGEFAVAAAASALFQAIATSALGLLALVHAAQVRGALPNPVVVLLLALVLLACVGAIALSPMGVALSSRLSRALAERLARIEPALNLARARWLPLLGLHGLGVLVRAGRLGLALVALGATPELSGVLLASVLADLALMTSLTPSALGLREAAVLWVAREMQVDPSTALAAAILDRVVWTAGLLALTPAGLARWLRGAPEPAR